jgi:hypothetical protein
MMKVITSIKYLVTSRAYQIINPLENLDYSMSMSTQEFAAFIAGEAKKWPPIIKAISFKAQ